MLDGRGVRLEVMFNQTFSGGGSRCVYCNDDVPIGNQEQIQT
jgi:hypothetical protein